MEDEIQTVIVDNGSSMCKAGFGGDDIVRVEFASVVGMIRKGAAISIPDAFIGDEAIRKRGVVHTMKCPIQRGKIKSHWGCDDMQRLWSHMFYRELRITPEEHPLLLTETPMNPEVKREMTVQTMFEHYEVPLLYLANQSVLSLYATGRTTGIVIDSGDGVSSTVPIYEGHAIQHATLRLKLAGSDISKLLSEAIGKKSQVNLSKHNIELSNIKERLCYVALDFEEEMKKAHETACIRRSYELPDENFIVLNDERFYYPEVLFQPNLGGVEANGIHENAFNSISQCDVDIHNTLYNNIVLAGGTTMFDGMTERMYKEIASLAPVSTKIKIAEPPERMYSAWFGGSMLSLLSTFKQMCATKQEYEEFGEIRAKHAHSVPNNGIARRKFF